MNDNRNSNVLAPLAPNHSVVPIGPRCCKGQATAPPSSNNATNPRTGVREDDDRSRDVSPLEESLLAGDAFEIADGLVRPKVRS